MAKLAMDDQFFFAKALQWYKRRDVREAIFAACESREVAPRYGEGFGKRPDALLYPADVLNLATKKATSFHCSEERWKAPLQLITGSSRKELDSLRTGWDLVLDVDCPYWLFAKLTAQLFISALREHGVASITVKFSGNKGFHIGVPWEAFPNHVNDRETKELFPEGPRAIATYLLDYIEKSLIKVQNNILIFDRKYKVSYERLKEATGKTKAELVVERCRRCGAAKQKKDEQRPLFLCTGCGHTTYHDLVEFLTCQRCGGVMEAQRIHDIERCTQCNGAEFEPRFNVSSLIEVDTILLASRHLFRTPYSLHEKSGLVSVVFPVDELMVFEKEWAKPEKIATFPKFLDASKTNRGEAAELLAKALEFSSQTERKGEQKEYTLPEEAIPEELFPPCITAMLSGMVDGKKRAMFALTNFLRSCGWGHDQLRARLEDWNKKNPEPLREVVLKGHLRYTKTKREVVLPPSCKSFYEDLHVCRPDLFCPFIKNPAQYAKRKAEQLTRGKRPSTPARPQLTDEQKEMRKAYRERMKGKEMGANS